MELDTDIRTVALSLGADYFGVAISLLRMILFWLRPGNG
jgi:hypothetical protein